MNFKYFYGTESDSYTFYRFPKLLITDDTFKSLSSDSKILYGLMLDRISLSTKNGWLDADKRVYIYYSLEDMKCIFTTDWYNWIPKNKQNIIKAFFYTK